LLAAAPDLEAIADDIDQRWRRMRADVAPIKQIGVLWPAKNPSGKTVLSDDPLQGRFGALRLQTDGEDVAFVELGEVSNEGIAWTEAAERTPFGALIYEAPATTSSVYGESMAPSENRNTVTRSGS